jgi:aldehyde reductase
VIPSLKQTLTDLGTEYVDLYLVHWPMGFKECTPRDKTPHAELFPKDADGKFIYSDVDYLETWTAMEECVTLGLTKSIGVSNFNSEQIERLLANCKIKPVMNQVLKGFGI